MTVAVVVTLACSSEEPPASAGANARAPAEAEPPAKADAKAEPPAKADEAAPSAPGLVGKLEEARVQTACTDLRMLRSAVEMFTAMKGACPDDLRALETERMIARLRDDPWGRAYRLRCTALELRSDGPDGEPGTDDDVVLGETGDECTPK